MLDKPISPPRRWQQIERLPESLYTAEQVRAIDAQAIAAGTPGIILMSRAARAALVALLDRWPAVKCIAVVCGSGNNAGDGYLLARMAWERGLQVKVLEVADAARLKGDALQARDSALAAGLKPEPFLPASLTSSCVIVDALLGTGLNQPLRSHYAAAINAINLALKPVLAIDVPSGVISDTGAIAGSEAVRADITVSFIALKRGLVTGAAVDYVGDILFADLAVKPSNTGAVVAPNASLLKLSKQLAKLPRRDISAYKNQSGHLLIIGGDFGMAGAPLLSAMAALRCGAGLVSVATRPEHIGLIVSRQPDIMAVGIDKTSKLLALIERATAIVIGPGLGQGAWSQQLLQQLKALTIPVLFDADGLNLLATNQHFLPSGAAVFTPHSGEAARLLGPDWDSKRINNDRFASAEALCERYGKTLVLKGAGSLVSEVVNNTTRHKICPYGNSAMATAGMGDILSGVIGSLMAQGLPVTDAAELGVCLHAAAADYSVMQNGQQGLVASDMPAALQAVINAMLADTSEQWR